MGDLLAHDVVGVFASHEITVRDHGDKVGALLDPFAELPSPFTAAEGIDVEVIDLRTLRPIDTATIIESVKKTTRLACVYEGVKTLGIGAEISARIAESEAFDYLDAPFMRLGGSESPIPYNPQLEKAAVPQVPGIIDGLRSLVKGRL